MSELLMTIEEEKENKKLLLFYLRKLHGKSIARELMRKYGNNLWGKGGLSSYVGKQSIEFFNLYYLQDTFRAKSGNTQRELSQLHYDIWAELEQMFILDKYDKEEFILPRGSSKTTTINMALSVWSHCYKKSRYTIVIGKRKKDAYNFIEDTKVALQNKYIEESFGKLVDSKKRTVNAEEIELTNDTKIQAFSSETSVRGTYYSCSEGRFRPSLFAIDDIISKDDILSEGAKEKVIDKFYNEIEKGGDEAVYRNGEKIKQATKFIVLGTPLAPDDFVNTIKRDIDFKVFHRSIVDFNIDEYMDNHRYWQTFKSILFNDKLEDSKDDAIKYYYDNVDKMKFSTIWDDKFECPKLAISYFSNRSSFMQELMCDCESIGERWFKSNRVQVKEEIESHSPFKNTILVVDPAGVKNANKSKSDYFAFVVGSISDNDFKYVRKGEILKFNEFDEYINHVLDLLKEFPDIKTLYVEKNSYLALDVDRIKQEIVKDKELVARNIEIINKQQNKNKDERISTIVDLVNNGRIIFCDEGVMKEALQQMMEFSGQATTLHDDFVDCVAEFSSKVEEVKKERKPISLLDRRLLGL